MPNQPVIPRIGRYRAEAAVAAPPVRKMLDMGIPVGAGTDGTRVSSYNPWVSLYWLVSGKTVGGLQPWDDANKLTHEEALCIFTSGSAWFSQERNRKRHDRRRHVCRFSDPVG